MGKQTLMERILGIAKEIEEKYPQRVAIIIRDGEVHASLYSKQEMDDDMKGVCTVVVRTKYDGSLEVLKRRE